MTKRFQKSMSVRLSVCNANKKAYFAFIIDSRIIIRISGERAYHPLQENATPKFLKKMFFKNLGRIFEKLRNACSLIINSRIISCISDERAWHLLQENKVIFSKVYIFQFSTEFLKNYILAHYFCVIGSRRIF